MATQQAVTSSNEAPITDKSAVESILEEHHFGHLNTRIRDSQNGDGPTLAIFGEDTFRVFPISETGGPDRDTGPVTEEFLSEIAEHIAPDERLDIRSVSHTKCRHPVGAARYVATPDEISYTDLSQGLSPISDPASSD